MTVSADISAKLREDYRRLIRQHGIEPDAEDPFLSALFETLALRLDAISTHARQILPIEILDQIIGSLRIPQTRSRPAQTVVSFSTPKGWDSLDQFTPLVALSDSGDRLTFRLDTELIVSEARLAFSAAYQDGVLTPLPIGPYPPAIDEAYLRDPVRSNMGNAPFLLIALDVLPEVHMDRHGLFFELASNAGKLQQSLANSIWYFLDESGMIHSNLIMRSAQSTGGVRALNWVLPERTSSDPVQKAVPNRGQHAEGFYGNRAYRFPPIPQQRRVTALYPKTFDEAFHRLFGKAISKSFNVPRVWVKILLPREIPRLDQVLLGIRVNSTTASNIDIFNETVRLADNGRSIPISREGRMEQHLVAPIAIINNKGIPYWPAEAVQEGTCAGKYHFERGKLELMPNRAGEQDNDDQVTVSLLVSDGARGNNVPQGGIRNFANKIVRPGFKVDNPMQSAGGTDSVPHREMKDYFSDMIRSRERLVTRHDIDHFLRSLDRRIQSVDIEPALVRKDNGGLQRLFYVTVVANAEDFADANIECVLLAKEIESELELRAPIDLGFRVEFSLK
jgi:hypothetical protein